MVFTYSTDAPADRDRLRLLIADTTEEDSQGNRLHVFEDEELDTMLDMAGGDGTAHVYAAAAVAIRSRVADLAQVATVRTYGQGGLEVNAKDATERLLRLADLYDDRASANAPLVIHDWSADVFEDWDDAVGGTWHNESEEQRQGEWAT